jgi:hypothetical protein
MNLKELHTPTKKEIEDFFEKRTKKHIDLVKKYAQKIADTNSDLIKVVDQAKNHDASKYENPEYEPYLHLTWRYKCKNENDENYEIPKNIDDNKASFHHIKSNRHHPEFHDDDANEDESLNKNNRDAQPDRITDASNMNNIDIAEMVADWCAMSEELGENNPKDWANKNINKRWKFTNRQSDLIYKLIDDIWD